MAARRGPCAWFAAETVGGADQESVACRTSAFLGRQEGGFAVTAEQRIADPVVATIAVAAVGTAAAFANLATVVAIATVDARDVVVATRAAHETVELKQKTFASWTATVAVAWSWALLHADVGEVAIAMNVVASAAAAVEAVVAATAAAAG